MDERERRLAENEVFFREVNERIDQSARGFGREEVYDFLCECANLDCTFRLELSAAEYERVRSEPRQFVIRPLHHFPEVERVVARTDGYWIVEKDEPEAADYVAERDPRSS